MKLYYLGQPGDGFGWGVCNTNLVSALRRNGVDVEVDCTDRKKFDAPVFVPVGDSSLRPVRRIKKAPKVFGYCFTEWPLEDGAERNARQYDTLFAGSSWNTDKLVAAGVKRAKTLIQGVDFDIFKPQPPARKDRFVVFSGGKWEFRKGQDYVIAAMREFMKHRDDVVLLAAWHNPWPQTMKSMDKSWLVDNSRPLEGLPLERVVSVPAVPNASTPSIYAQSHVGIFPNRCEAGTNMVMCEYMACGRPVIASYAHGHEDVLGGPGPMRLEAGSYDAAGWFNPNVSDILFWLEYAYQNREALEQHGSYCRENIERFTWDAAASVIAAEL